MFGHTAIMNAETKAAFGVIKPVCDVVMVRPTEETIQAFKDKISGIKKEALQELQQYIMFPFITHIKSTEMEKKYELQCKIVDAMRSVLDKVQVTSYEMCMKIESGLLGTVFDSTKPGMIAEVPEELKLTVMRCLSVLNINLDTPTRAKLLKTQLPLLAQAVFVSMHMAKLEQLRLLRLSGLISVMALTATHPALTNDQYHIADPNIESLAVDMLTSILPGVLAALQDVATCTNNPGHAVVAVAINAIHRILCVTMHEKHLPVKDVVTVEDFTNLLKDKDLLKDKEVSSKVKPTKNIIKRSPEWYAMAGEKLEVVTKSLVCLTTHEHHRVRKELAVFCARILNECSATMQPSISTVLDVVISLSKDEHPEVSEYCRGAVRRYFSDTSPRRALRATDSLCENLFNVLSSLPRVLNNIDASRKLSALNLLHGYVILLCDDNHPQKLTTALCTADNMQCACDALTEAATMTYMTYLREHTMRDVCSPAPKHSPWCKLKHLDSSECEWRLQEICRLLGSAECAELILDKLLESFQQRRDCELVYVMNYMGAGPNSSRALVQRILDTYIEEDVWYLPLEVGSNEAPLTRDDTYDVSVYNPRAWTKDTVPGLFEGTVETRYTDISYRAPRPAPPPDPTCCATLGEAHRNMVLSCLLTEGVGIMATTLRDDFQPYLLKTLSLVLERVGSKYEMLHLAGLKAINAIAVAGGHQSVGELIKHNADYFTNQVTVRLKKAWNSQSALEILSVVMEYSDSEILDYLYGIVEDVLVQSCDKYHEKDLRSYLQVFLTFIECIRKWFPVEYQEKPDPTSQLASVDVLRDVVEYVNSTRETERLLNEEIESETGRSVEEMFRDDLRQREEDVLDYDDTVAHETPPLPRHIKVTLTILKRCINFVSSRNREETILSLQVLTLGLPILAGHDDELLPLVHLTWGPLVARFGQEPVLVRRAFELLVVMAELAKDFIRARAVKEVLPQVYQFLHSSAPESRLKDAGSSYRASQAFKLQVTALAVLPGLLADLRLEDQGLQHAMACVDPYLSNKQPKPLQALAVEFFKRILEYDYGAAWLHLQEICGNDRVLLPPPNQRLQLEPVTGTPYLPINKDYENNVALIFN